MTDNRPRRVLLVWAVLGGLVLIGALVAIIVTSLGGEPRNDPLPMPSTSGTPSVTPPPPTDDFVDPSVVEHGWVPEPITRDPDEYARAALEAAGTFDTHLATRAEWAAWLGSWFTPSPLYEREQDAADQLARYLAELDQSVLLPQEQWDSLAREGGRVSGHVEGEIHYLELPETTKHRMWTASADVVMSYTRTTPTGEVSYDETVRVSVQVVCGGVSVPTSGSAQQTGDCKVVRFFDEAVG